MLSGESEPSPPVDSHREAQWTVDLTAELRRRMRTVKAVYDDPAMQHAIKRYLRESGADGLVAFARDWCWTLDPRNQRPLPKNVPMLLWPRQEEFLRALYECEEKGVNLLVAKSRDTGVTWLLVIYFVWRWLFVPGWVGGLGSRKEELLDRKGDPKSMFEKVRWIVNHIPRWLRPVGYDKRHHDNFKRLINPETGAVIAGEAGPDMGRGGRSAVYGLDEFGKMPDPQSVDAAVSGNTECIVYIHTATEPDSYFNTLRLSGRVRVFEFSWKADPRKSPSYRDWYAGKYGEQITKRELDIDFDGSSASAIIPSKWVDAARGLDLGAEEGAVVSAGLDVGAGTGSGDESVLILRRGGTAYEVHSWRDLDPSQLAHAAGAIAEDEDVEMLRYDNIGVGAGIGGTFASLDELPSFAWHGVNVGEGASLTFYDDAPERRANLRFANLKAELWWSVRLRFEATYKRFVLGDERVPVEACISIPDDPVLAAQLSVQNTQTTARGLIRIESKDSLRKRGISSPDRADALVLAFADSVGGALLFGTA